MGSLNSYGCISVIVTTQNYMQIDYFNLSGRDDLITTKPNTKTQENLLHILWGILYVWGRHFERLNDIYLGLTSGPAWISNHFDNKMCDEITPPFPNFNGTTIEACEWISNSKPYTQLDMWVFFIQDGV